MAQLERKWNDDSICKALMKIVNEMGIKTMPSHKEMKEFYGDCALTNAVSKHGGTKRFSKILGLPIRGSETEFGMRFEEYCALQIEEKLNLRAARMTVKHPYDILVADSVKVDVKSGRLYVTPQNTSFFTFNLEKKEPTCDVFVCYCVSKTGVVEKTYIIPSFVLRGKCQLSIGVRNSVYDKYLDAWCHIKHYADFITAEV